jgi:excisionase family DNA binding protein
MPSEVAVLFRVNPRTIDRWAEAGRIPSFKTMGGHRRFYADEIEPIITSTTGGAA